MELAVLPLNDIRKRSSFLFGATYRHAPARTVAKIVNRAALHLALYYIFHGRKDVNLDAISNRRLHNGFVILTIKQSSFMRLHDCASF